MDVRDNSTSLDLEPWLNKGQELLSAGAQAATALTSEAIDEMKAHPYITAASIAGLAATVFGGKSIAAVDQLLEQNSLSTEKTVLGKIIGRISRTAVVSTDDDLELVATRRPHVRNVSFRRWSSITDSGMSHISQLNNLRTLDMSFSQVTDIGTEAAGLDKLPRLSSFIARRSDVGDATVSMLARRQGAMDLVDLRKTTGMTRSIWIDLTRMRTQKLLLNNCDTLDTPVKESLRKFAYENFIDYGHLTNNIPARLDPQWVPNEFRI